ncbi:hypothetical protein ABZY45_09165 [Streptomyces sp. NPDC006516]|uniref:hypothetical protein n=1 Tax=Streptomyces sp. NPDC006516 TaxID=3154309 RepID=UPI0033B20709
MTTTVPNAPAVAPLRSDSPVVAERSPIRMARIPNPVRRGGFQFNSTGRHDLRLSARTEGMQ